MNIVKLVFAFIFSLSTIINPFIQFAFHGGIDSYFDKWSKDDKFTSDYAVELKKDPNKDFVILNLADIQLGGEKVFREEGEYTEKLIRQAIEEVKPDLITLTGDNSLSAVGYIELIKLLDSYKIPWAPIMGNHDGDNGNRILEAWDSYLLSDSEYCLFKFGPENMGYGNYMINITENGQIIHTLFMMDTHSDADDTEYGTINYGKKEDGTDNIGYDHLWANQIEWYSWGVKGVTALAGKTVESTVFTHIPNIEYRTARDLMCDYVNGEWVLKDEYKDKGFGSLKESVCSPEGNNGFFSTVLELGSTKNIISGHDHKNDLCLNYMGVNLNFAKKTGHGSYYTDDKMGTSILTINSEGHATFSHHPYTAE